MIFTGSTLQAIVFELKIDPHGWVHIPNLGWFRYLQDTSSGMRINWLNFAFSLKKLNEPTLTLEFHATDKDENIGMKWRILNWFSEFNFFPDKNVTSYCPSFSICLFTYLSPNWNMCATYFRERIVIRIW